MTAELLVGLVIFTGAIVHAIGFILLGRWCYLISRMLMENKK